MSDAYESLFRQGHDSDFAFIIGDEDIKAHKAVLRARVPHFAKIFSQGTADDRLEMEVADSEAFKEVLRHIYCGKLPDNMKALAHNMLPFADMYELAELRDACVHAMERSLTQENVCDTLIVADTYASAGLKRKCLERLTEWKASMKEDCLRSLEEHPKLLVELVKSL